MLRYIDINSDGTTIERFPINGGSIWLAKRGDKYGISLDKNDAVTELNKNAQYAQVGLPLYLNLPGKQIQNNYDLNVFSLPGAGKFIDSLLSLELKQEYYYDTVYCEELNAISIICKPTLNRSKDNFVLHTSQGHIPDQIRRCIYQLYIEIDKGIDFDLKIRDTNMKQRDWIKQWYKRLPARGFSL